MSGSFLQEVWLNAEVWRLILAAVCGVAVGIVYFYSLAWSINRFSELKHKLKLFALTALCRIALFFGVLLLIADRKVSVIVFYVIAFFLTKTVIVGAEKAKLLKSDEKTEQK